MFWCKSLPTLTLETVRGFQRRAFRNGGWRRLTAFEKAILRASALYAQIMGKIVNRKLVEIILNVADKIGVSRESRIVRLGLNRVTELRSLCLKKQSPSMVPPTWLLASPEELRALPRNNCQPPSPMVWALRELTDIKNYSVDLEA